MMRKAVASSIGMAAMLALAACSGTSSDVDQAEYDAVLAERDGLRSDVSGARSDLADTQASLAAARARSREAEDLHLLAEQNARIARLNYENAQRDFENGLLSGTQLQNARDEARRAQTVAEAARKEREDTRKAEQAGVERLRALAEFAVQSRALPKSYGEVAAQTVTIQSGKSMTIGNIKFDCDSDSPAPGCVITVTADGRFESNVVFVTASLVVDPVTNRLFSGTIGDGDVAAVHFPRTQTAGGDANNVSVFIRESGASDTTDYRVTATSLGNPLVGVASEDRDNNMWRLYAGTEDDRPEGHDGFVAVDFKVEAAPGTSKGWSLASLDGLDGVETDTEFGEGEPWTKSWMVEGADLGGGREISMDVYTNIEATTTTRMVDDAFSDAEDRAAVKAALDNGFELVHNLDNTASTGGINSGAQGNSDDLIPNRYGAQLEIRAANNVRRSGVTAENDRVDESQWIRFSRIEDGGGIPVIDFGARAGTENQRYQLSALDATAAGTRARFYGIPGKVVCGERGGSRVCGTEVEAFHSQGGLVYPNPQPYHLFMRTGSSGVGGLTFTADAGEHEFYVPDADWVSIGIWSVQPSSGGEAADVQMGAFVHGSMPWDYADADIGYSETLSADYEGDAVGHYAHRDAGNQVESGKFKATVNLAFALGASAEAGRLSGTITDFRLGDNEGAENWRLELPATHSYNLLYDAPEASAPCGANLVTGSGGTGCGNLGELQGLANGLVMTGKMNARAFGPSATGVANQTPATIAGTFFAEQNMRAGRSDDLSLMGAFLADRTPAATE